MLYTNFNTNFKTSLLHIISLTKYHDILFKILVVHSTYTWQELLKSNYVLEHLHKLFVFWDQELAFCKVNQTHFIAIPDVWTLYILLV